MHSRKKRLTGNSPANCGAECDWQQDGGCWVGEDGGRDSEGGDEGCHFREGVNLSDGC